MGEGVLRLRPGPWQDLPRHYEPKFVARVGTLYSRFASRSHRMWLYCDEPALACDIPYMLTAACSRLRGHARTATTRTAWVVE